MEHMQVIWLLTSLIALPNDGFEIKKAQLYYSMDACMSARTEKDDECVPLSKQQRVLIDTLNTRKCITCEPHEMNPRSNDDRNDAARKR